VPHVRPQWFVLSLSALVFVFASAACDARGLNDPDSFAIHFRNDLPVPVVIALCHSDHSAKCEHPYYRDRARPGASYPENISPDVRTEWAIENDSGRLLRCVVLYWKHWPGHDMEVQVSQAPRWTNPCLRQTSATALR